MLFEDYKLQREASEFVETKILPKILEARINDRNYFQIKEVLRPALFSKVKDLLKRKRIKIQADATDLLSVSF